MINKETILELINRHPEGLDDDDIAELMGIRSRQQVQQVCNQLVDSQRIRRQSIGKIGKRRKIHNFPTMGDPTVPTISAVAGPENGGGISRH